MTMPKKSGILFVIMGAVLIVSALLLFFYNRYEEYRAGQEAELLLDDIQSAMEAEKKPYMQATHFGMQATDSDIRATDSDMQETDSDTQETEVEIDSTEETGPEEELPAEMPVVMINGYEYIGYLSIPDLELDLPVMAEWDYKRLKVAPCRHFGSTRTDDLVIAAHNYKTHFGFLSRLKVGAEVIFTDMDGIENRYKLMKDPETLAPNAVDEVLNSGYDLVLYTCTPGGATRVVVFCDRVREETEGEEQDE